MSSLIWVHNDALRRDHPVFAAAPDDARAVYVWDKGDFARRDWSLKRCVFLLECLSEMQVEIIEGELLSTLDGTGASIIYTAATPDPHYRDMISNLETQTQIVSDKRFATLPDGADKTRFFRYWNKVRKSALSPTQKSETSA
jgi:hypothetical protein